MSMNNSFLKMMIILFALSVSSCSIIKPVTVTGVSDFHTVNRGTEPEIWFNLELINPNNFTVTIKKVDIGISMGDQTLVSSKIIEETQITKKEKTLVTGALKPSAESMAALFKSGIDGFLSGKQNQFQVTGEILIKKFIFTRKYPVKESIKF